MFPLPLIANFYHPRTLTLQFMKLSDIRVSGNILNLFQFLNQKDIIMWKDLKREVYWAIMESEHSNYLFL